MGTIRNILCAAVFLSVFCSSVTLSQTLSWQWAHGAGHTGEDMAESIVADDSGYVYATGSFASATITFGAFTLTNAGVGTADIILVKYNSNGTVVWAKSFGSADGDIGHGISLDANGNVYLTGWFSSSMVTMGNHVLLNSGNGTADVFVAKFTPSGNTLWAKSAGGIGADVAYSIAADVTGNTYITGMFLSPSATFGAHTLNNAGGNAADIFIVCYNASGAVLWAKSAGGPAADIGYSAAVDANGNAYFTGWFASPSLSFGTNTITNAGGNDLFAVKYDATGNALWIRNVGGTGNEMGNSIASDNSGNIFIAGSFDSPSLSIGNATLTNQGGSDCMLIKYDVSGNPAWASSVGALYDDAGTGIVVSSSGEVYVTGKYFSQNITFGSTTLTNVNPGAFDLFVARYDATGNAAWAIGAGGSFQDVPNSICMNTTGTIYIAGKFDSPTIVFGPSTLYKGCVNDFFVAMLGNNSVEVKEFKTENEIFLIPNPAVKTLMAYSPVDVQSYRITDISGKCIYETTLHPEQKTINCPVAELNSGIYFIHFMSAGKTVIKKFVKKTLVSH